MMSAKLLFEKIFGDLGCWGGIGIPGMLLEKVVGNTIGQVCGRMGKWVYVRCAMHLPKLNSSREAERTSGEEAALVICMELH